MKYVEENYNGPFENTSKIIVFWKIGWREKENDRNSWIQKSDKEYINANIKA